MKLTTLYLPESYIKTLDQLVDEGFYPAANLRKEITGLQFQIVVIQERHKLKRVLVNQTAIEGPELTGNAAAWQG